ncbi:MAG: protein-disulfide reductase DsbD family protein [Vicinamibacterales bacterium]|nr:protein-disulfide reductase DsbD family protein [Vicinamibacterales bacterium]
MTNTRKASALSAVAALVLSLSAVAAAPAQPLPSAGRTATAPFVKAELIADAEPGPDGRFWLGVRFHLEDGWHLYWQNPGDSGAPPVATWHAPQDWRVGAFEWPAPARIDAGGLINYGYHGTVVLPVPVTPAAAGAVGGRVAVSLRWLVCRDMCVAGKADLALSLPLGAPDQASAADWRAAVTRARSQVPLPAPPSWSASARATRDSLAIEIVTGQPETEATVFPLDVSQVDDSAPQAVTGTETGVRVVLRKSAQLLKDPDLFRGVVSLSGGRTFVVTAPLVR